MEYNIFRMERDKEMDLTTLSYFLEKHRKQINERYKKLHDAYVSDMEILHQSPKPEHKADNRVCVNFPKSLIL